jgi:AcrR family transcriptional regulator
MASSVNTRQRNPRGAGGRLRLEIIQATTRLVDQGIERLSLSAIAREAGIAQPSIYDHFPGLESIRTQVIRNWYDDLIDRISQAQVDVEDPVQRVEATCFAYVGYGAAFPHRYALLFRAERDDDERRAVGDRGAAALHTLVEGIAACKTAGRSTSVDPYVDAVALWSAIHGLTTLRASRPHFAQLHSNAMLRDIVHRLACIGAAT